MAQQAKDLMAQVTAVAWIQSPAWEFPHVMGVTEKETPNQNLTLHSVFKTSQLRVCVCVLRKICIWVRRKTERKCIKIL